MLPIRNISYLLPMCCSFWEKCKNSQKSGLGCSTPLNIKICFNFAGGGHFWPQWTIFPSPPHLTPSPMGTENRPRKQVPFTKNFVKKTLDESTREESRSSHNALLNSFIFLCVETPDSTPNTPLLINFKPTDLVTEFLFSTLFFDHWSAKPFWFLKNVF